MFAISNNRIYIDNDNKLNVERIKTTKNHMKKYEIEIIFFFEEKLCIFCYLYIVIYIKKKVNHKKIYIMKRIKNKN